MALRWLALFSLWSFWHQSTFAGCAWSAPEAANDACSAGPSSASPNSHPLYPSGILIARLRLMWDKYHEDRNNAESDGFVELRTFMYQAPQTYPSLSDHQFWLRIIDSAMHINIEYVHQDMMQSPIQTFLLGQFANYDNDYVDSPQGQRMSYSFHNFGPLRIDYRQFSFSDLHGFDLSDALHAIKHNWNRRIYFTPYPIEYIVMETTRFPPDYWLRFLRNKVVFKLIIDRWQILLTPLDGPEFAHIYALPYAFDRPEITALTTSPIWLQRALGTADPL